MKSDKAATKAFRNGRRHANEILEHRKDAQRRRARALKKLGIEQAPRTSAMAKRAGAPRASAGMLVAEGDSWFDYPLHDILKGLEDDHAYDVESVAHHGDIVEDMAYTDQLAGFTSRLEKLLRNGIIPKAVLLSGGGNDIAGTEFAGLLNHALSANPGLNSNIVAGVIDERLRDAYIAILSSVTRLCEGTIGQSLPILIHGYDYAVPDGRGVAGGFWFFPGPWLDPGFRRKGYEGKSEADKARRQAMIKTLINRFNEMVQGVARLPQFRHVTFIDLRGTLSTGSDYKTWWANELHPTSRGFAAVTNKFAEALNNL